MAGELVSLEDVRALLVTTNNDLLAEVLKICAAEMLTRQIPGHELLFDVAYTIHERESTRRIEGYLLQALQRASLPPNQP